jgi:hypothetical protein
MVMVIVGVIAAVIVIATLVAVIFFCVRRKSPEKSVNGIGNFENPAVTGHADFVMSPTRPEVDEYDQIPADEGYDQIPADRVMVLSNFEVFWY